MGNYKLLNSVYAQSCKAKMQNYEQKNLNILDVVLDFCFTYFEYPEMLYIMYINSTLFVLLLNYLSQSII